MPKGKPIKSLDEKEENITMDEIDTEIAELEEFTEKRQRLMELREKARALKVLNEDEWKLKYIYAPNGMGVDEEHYQYPEYNKVTGEPTGHVLTLTMPINKVVSVRVDLAEQILKNQQDIIDAAAKEGITIQPWIIKIGE